MTQALCMFCGSTKFGALSECESCGEPPPDMDLALLFTDHYLTGEELTSLGQAVRTVQGLGLDDETSLMAFLYYVGRRWPKLLTFDADELPPETASVLDSVYRSHLVDLPGQRDESLQRPPWEEAGWLEPHPDQAAREDRWRKEVPQVVRLGLQVGGNIIKLLIEAGEGALLQRLQFRFSTLFRRPDFAGMARRAGELVDQAAEYRRLVQRFRQGVQRGWSGRTRRQAEYLGGTHVRLEEMAELTESIIRSKAGWEDLTRLEREQKRQKLDGSYRMFIELIEVVTDPKRIQREQPPGARAGKEPNEG